MGKLLRGPSTKPSPGRSGRAPSAAKAVRTATPAGAG